MATVVKYILDIDTKKSAQALRDLAKVTEDLDKDLSLVKKAGSSAKTGLDNTSKGMTGLTKAANPLSMSLGKVKDTALQMANTLVAASKEVFNFVTEAVDAVNRLNDMATASGLAAETIQAVELAFRASGQAASAGDTILKKFPQRMADIRKKGSEANQIIKAMGIEIRDTAGNFRDSDSVFKDIISNLQGIEDQELKTATAQKIFKRDVGNLLVALGNSGPLERFINFTKNFGVDAKKSAGQAATFQQRIAALSIAFSFARDRIVAAFGGMKAFNSLLLESVGAIVFVTEMISLFSGEIIALSKNIFNFVKNRLVTMVTGLSNVGLVAKAASIGLQNIGHLLKPIAKATTPLDEYQKRIRQAKDRAREAKKELSEFGKNIELSADDAKAATERMQKLKDAIDKLFGEGDKGAKGQKKSTQDLQKEQDRAIAKFKELQAVVADGDTSAKSALKSTNKLMRVFDRLKLPVKEVFLFQQALRRKIETKEIEKLEAKQAAAVKKFNELRAAFDAGNISAERALAKALQMTGTFKDLRLPTDQVNSFTSSLSKLKEQAEKIKKIESRINLVADISTAGAASDGAAIAKVLSDKFKLLPKEISTAILGALGALEELGKKTPEEILEEGKQRNTAIANGIAMLPAVLIDVFPRLLLDLAIKIVAGIGKAIVEAFASLGRLFTDMIEAIKEFFTSPVDAIHEGFGNFVEFLSAPFGGEKLGGGRVHFPAGEGGLRFTGRQRGLALLHPGEVVTPRSGRMSQGLQRRFEGGQAPNIVINSAVVDGNVIDTLVRQIEERFLTFGTSQSTLFGGG